MAFYPNSYNTLQYEVRGLSDSSTPLPPGTAVTYTKLPTGPSTPALYFNFAVASSTDEVHGVVSASVGAPTITDVLPGKVVGMNSGIIPVLLGANGTAGQYVKVKGTSGKFEPCIAGELSDAILLETATIGNLAWAKPIKKVV